MNPLARIIDISHASPVFNIEAGKYLIETSYGNFPSGTIHVGIIDPTVGTKRKAILIETEDYFFIGPDNGLFSFLATDSILRIISLTAGKYHLRPTSATFHGRDIFAPVAGYLSLGVMPDEFGRKLPKLIRLKERRYTKRGGQLIGRIIYVDHFGNLVTSFRQTDLPESRYSVYLNGHKIGALRETYDRAKKGRALCYINSFGYLEIAINWGSAADYFDINSDLSAKILIAPVICNA